jgi:hypothetical protein
MIKVAYAKFYQAVQIGAELLTHVSEGNKPVGVYITWDQGLMKLEKPGVKTVFVPTANVMFFHQQEAAEEKRGPGRPKSA